MTSGRSSGAHANPRSPVDSAMFSNARLPETVTLMWCPVCGRNDRFTPFTGRAHYSGGSRCSGKPVAVTYRIGEGLRGE